MISIMKYFSIIFVFLIMSVSSVYAADASTRTANEVTAYIIHEVNVYRASYGLSPVKTSDETCRFAEIRAKEISTNFSHAGFEERYKNGTLPYKSWSVIKENLAMTSDYKKVVDMWIHSPGHAANMRADTPYVCVRQYGSYFAYLGMRPK